MIGIAATRSQPKQRCRWLVPHALQFLLHVLLVALAIANASAALTDTSVVPESLAAGVETQADVTFTTSDELSIGSHIAVTFPAGFELSATATTLTVDAASFATTLSVASVTTTDVYATIETEGVAAATAFKFSITSVTNPAAHTTDVFTIATHDANDALITQDAAVAGVTIVSTELTAVSLGFGTVRAGRLNTLTLDMTTGVVVPRNGFVVIELPTEVSSPFASAVYEEVATQTTITGLALNQQLKFQMAAPLAIGHHSITIAGVRNPGVIKTGSFKIATTDVQERPLETGTTAGITVVAGPIVHAAFAPVRSHPGVPSKVQVSFTTSAQLDEDSLVQVELPGDDYSAVASTLSVVVDSPAGVTALASWDATHAALLVLITSGIAIPQDATVAFTVHAFRMPASVRSETTASAIVHTWNAAGLQLDGPDAVTLRAITAVQSLPSVWKTSTARPGVTSNVEITFDTSGAIPVGGQIVVSLPALDFTASAGVLTAMFSAPGVTLASSVWDAPSTSIILTIGGAVGIAEYASGLTLTVNALNTPLSERASSRAGVVLTTKDAQGGVIDGPSAVAMDAITPGLILGSRMWIASKPFAGVVSDQTVTFFNSGKLTGGSSIAITMPDVKWSMASSGTATVSTPALGVTDATTAWDATSRLVTITLGATVTIPSSSVITVMISRVSNPPKETGVCNAAVVTRAPDGFVIDGPGTLSIMDVSRGAVAGAKTWTSTTTASASMKSDHMLRVTLSGALPSGSFFIITLPVNVGWRFAASQAPSAAFTLPASGLSVKTISWSALSSELRIETLGNLTEGAAIELVVNDVITPYSQQSASVLTLTTSLADAGIVDQSTAIAVNSIVSSALAQVGTWTANVPTPGVESTQTIALTIGGSLEAGATLCLSLAAANGWIVSFATEAAMHIGALAQATPVTMQWDAVGRSLCVVVPSAIAQESSVELQFTKMRSPPSARLEQRISVAIRSHLGGLVNTGTVAIHAIAKGALTGALTWLSLLFSPGPVAGLLTSATLAFQTTGRVVAGGQLVLTLPVEWQLDADCIVSFQEPVIDGTATCANNVLAVLLSDTIDQYTAVKLLLTSVRNPPSVQPAGTAVLQTVASDGGLIDDSAAVSTAEIPSALTAIASTGDVRTAVAGVKKTFAFQGFHVANGDVLKFVDASTTSDLNCGAAVSGVSDAGGIDITAVSSDLTAALTFTQSSRDGQPFAICYKFGANPFKLYAGLSFVVKEILAVATDVGVPHIAVADYAKTWTFTGRGIARGDQVRWVNVQAVNQALVSSTSVDCTDVASLAKLVPAPGVALDALEDDYTRNVQLPGQTQFTFDKAQAGETFALCYKFGAEPFTVYSRFMVQVNHVTAIQATLSGSDSVAVVDALKPFTFIGDGLALNDRVYFISTGSDTTCASSSTNAELRVKHTIASQEQTALYLTDRHETSVRFTDAVAGKRVVPCYQFGTEPYQLYATLVIEVKMVSRFIGTLGSPLFAVATVPEPLTFVGYGLEPADQVRWMLTGEEDCESNLASLLAADTLEPIDTVVLDATVSGAFNFATSQLDYSPVLCYKFGTEAYKLYANLPIKIGTVRAKGTAVGAKDVAVVAAHKVFTLSGTHLAANDRVAWTTSRTSKCATLSLLVQDPAAPDDDYTAYTNERSEVSVALAAVNSGKRVYLCYGFGTEPLKLYEALYLDVKSVLAMRTLVGSNTVAVAGALKSFLFDGDGVASGDVAKFVPATATSCDAPGITLLNIMKEFDDYAEMAMYLYENIPGVTVGSYQFASDATSAGLARVLCYRFASEPFFFYEAFAIDVKTIWGLTRVDKTVGGQDTVAVVNERKLVRIDGVGVSERDQAKFVDALAASDQDCADLPARGLVSQDLKVSKNTTMWFPFQVHSNGSAWKLCYKFDDEPFRLYARITVQVKQVLDLVDADAPQNASLGRVATIEHVKRWQPVGAGVQVGDTVKFVSQSVQSSADCGVASTNTAGGSVVMTVSGAALVFTGVLTEFPASPSDAYHLCYKFQDEPFAYIQGYELRTYGVLSLDRSTFLAEAATPIQISGFRLATTDRVGWTTSAKNCSSVVGITDVTDQMTTTVSFAMAISKLYLCYSFDRQPFALFPDIAITVAQAEIWVPQTTSVVADQEVQLTVAGTFGLTVSSDQIAWVPSDAPACSPDVLAAYASVMRTSVVSTSPSETSIARSGAAVFRVKFVPSGAAATAASSAASLSTWKLCYRFGNLPAFLMFSDVLCDVLNIEQVTLLQSEPGTAGSVLTFEFDGVGTQDFDSAKWVAAADAVTDADCDILPAVGGSLTTFVVNRLASYTFAQTTASMALCYKFQSHAFKLFASIPVQGTTARVTSKASSSAPATALAQFDDERDAVSSGTLTLNRDVAAVALTLDMNIQDIPSGSLAETQFKAAFVSAVAASLGIGAARIRILALVEGSVIVQFELLPSDNVADPLVHQVIVDLQTQLAVPTSALRQSDVITVADPATALSVSILTLPPVVATASSTTALQARGYQRSGLFTFVKSVYSVTENTPRLVVPVLRLQGVDSAITLVVRMDAAKRTATPEVDYRLPSAASADTLFLRFGIGDVVQFIDVAILDDGVKEAHFEYFTLELVDPSTPGAALGGTPATVVRIFDFDDGHELIRHRFPVSPPSSSKTAAAAVAAAKTNGLSWRVVENGDSAVRVDSSGLFAVDAVVGDSEYDEKCDLASPTGECAFACSSGGSDAMDTPVSARNVLELREGDYVASQSAMSSFPTEAFSLSLWVKTDQRTPRACLVSYAVSATASRPSSRIPLALCNPSSLELSVNARTQRDKLSTFVNISDSAWHLLAVTWSAVDGRVRLYDNGMLAFDGGPFRVSDQLEPGGVLILGGLAASSVSTPCTVSSSSSSTTTTTARVACTLEPGSSFVGRVQHVHLWSRVISRADVLKELAWPMQVATNGLVFGWNFDAAYVLGEGTAVTDIATKGQAQKTLGAIHCVRASLSPLSSSSSPPSPSSCLVAGVIPSVSPSFPCGRVYANIWHFAAPLSIVEQLRRAYGGRLQYQMLAPSFNGAPRARRGQLSIFDSAGNQISLALGTFPLPIASQWTSYVVVLREDFGWISEPSGAAVSSSVFKALLADAAALWVRGDLWGADESGQGQEAVYINHVAVFAR